MLVRVSTSQSQYRSMPAHVKVSTDRNQHQSVSTSKSKHLSNSALVKISTSQGKHLSKSPPVKVSTSQNQYRSMSASVKVFISQSHSQSAYLPYTIPSAPEGIVSYNVLSNYPSSQSDEKQPWAILFSAIYTILTHREKLWVCKKLQKLWFWMEFFSFE